jgi:hypothetical protein
MTGRISLARSSGNNHCLNQSHTRRSHLSAFAWCCLLSGIVSMFAASHSALAQQCSAGTPLPCCHLVWGHQPSCYHLWDFTCDIAVLAFWPCTISCQESISIGCGSSIYGTTEGAPATNPPACPPATNTAGVWYDIVGNDEWVVVDTCDGLGSPNTSIAVYLDVNGDCSNLGSCIAESSVSQHGCPAPDAASVEFFAFSGLTYRIYFSPQGPPSPFALSASCGLGPPANDECSNAEPIVPFLADVFGWPVNNDNATTDGPPELCGGFAGDVAGNSDSDVWFEFVSPCAQTYTFSVSPQGGGPTTYLAVYEGGCPQTGGTLVGCDFGVGGAAAEVKTVVGETYFVRAGSPPGQQGAFDLAVNRPCPTDLTNSGHTGGAGLLFLLAGWGDVTSSAVCMDFNHDGVIDGLDMLLLLSEWGPCP